MAAIFRGNPWGSPVAKFRLKKSNCFIQQAIFFSILYLHVHVTYSFRSSLGRYTQG